MIHESQYILERRAAKLGLKPVVIKEPKKIATRSEKGKVNDRIHAQLKKDYLKDHPVCECGRPECKKLKSKDIHHKKGRGIELNNEEYFLAVSRDCHRWIELHPLESMRMGLIVSRLKS